ncbi:MAG: DUF4124 domain-containing protein [Myxococcaceae bacterium]
MSRFVPVIALVLTSTAIAADSVYRWKDASGIENYTNDLNTIPPNVTVVPTTGSELSEINVGRRETKRPATQASRGDADFRRAEAEAQLAEAQLRREEALQEERWRQLFRTTKARITSLQSELDRERDTIKDVTGGTASRVGSHIYAPNAMFARVKQLEQELKDAVEDYNDLDRRASYASVPRHWRN